MLPVLKRKGVGITGNAELSIRIYKLQHDKGGRRKGLRVPREKGGKRRGREGNNIIASSKSKKNSRFDSVRLTLTLKGPLASVNPGVHCQLAPLDERLLAILTPVRAVNDASEHAMSMPIGAAGRKSTKYLARHTTYTCTHTSAHKCPQLHPSTSANASMHGSKQICKRKRSMGCVLERPFSCVMSYVHLQVASFRECPRAI